MSDEPLGKRLKRLREEKRWTQADVALALQVDVKTVGNWESGRNHPRASVGALSAIFGVDVEDAAASPADPVEVAIRRSALHPHRQTELIAVYQRHLYEQGREVG